MTSNKERLGSVTSGGDGSRQVFVRVGGLVVALLIATCGQYADDAVTASGGAGDRTGQSATSWSWVRAESPTQADLLGIALTGPSDGWAVGADGAIVELAQGHWRNAQSPSSRTLTQVAFRSAQWGTAVGENGTIVEFDGRLWREVESPTREDLFDVATSSFRTYAVGAEGTVIAWLRNGRAIRQSSPGLEDIEGDLLATDIAERPGVSGWIVAGKNRAGLAAMFYQSCTHFPEEPGGPPPNGTCWSTVWTEHSEQPVLSFDLFDLESGFGVAGRDGVLCMPDMLWSVERLRATDEVSDAELRGVAALGGSDAWFVGTAGTILHYDGKTFSRHDLPTVTASLNDVAFVPSGQGWAVGEAGTILQYVESQHGALYVPIVQAF